MSKESIATILERCSGKILREVAEPIERLLGQCSELFSYKDVETQEQEIADLVGRLGALLLQERLQEAARSEALQAQEAAFIKQLPGRWVSEGYRDVTIRTRWGEIRIAIRYFRRKSRSAKARRKGIYPAQVLWGIMEGCTPWLGSQASALVAVVGSLSEAREVVKSWGVQLDVKTLRALALQWAQRARALQRQTGHFPCCEQLDGRCLVVCTDGGRIRIRTDKRGRRTAKKRRRYHTHWREPKLLILYEVDEQGRSKPAFAPLIDGTLKGPDVLAALLCYYLERLGAGQAARILFVADAAAWIWKRVPWIIELVGLAADRVLQLIDFYHAVEHLGKAAAGCARWSAAQRRRWVSARRRELLKGQIDLVIEALKGLSRRRPAVRTEYRYFLRHRDRMQYAKIRDLGLPIGSGAIESAVRRVVNLRLKGASIYWREESAEAMLMLRAFYKAGRWNLLKDMALSPEAACCA
jgi:hypothetical protein